MNTIKFDPCEDCVVRFERCSYEWCKAKEEYEQEKINFKEEHKMKIK